MQNNYFGKFDNSFILYIDPIHFDVINFSKHFSSVYCNEINFVNCQDEIQNAQLDLHTFIEKLKNKTISEFDLIFGDEIHIQNIWWDDLLVIANLDKLSLVLDLLKQTMSVGELSKLDICIESPNYYFSFDSIISKQEVTPNLFKDFIKDSDHYFDKEQKFI
jgi:hypothetical protein